MNSQSATCWLVCLDQARAGGPAKPGLGKGCNVRASTLSLEGLGTKESWHYLTINDQICQKYFPVCFWGGAHHDEFCLFWVVVNDLNNPKLGCPRGWNLEKFLLPLNLNLLKLESTSLAKHSSIFHNTREATWVNFLNLIMNLTKPCQISINTYKQYFSL